METSHEGPGLGAVPTRAPASAALLRECVAAAVLAPSRHNAQPWAFEIEGTELRVYGDWSRALHAADPEGRELVMACGAALQNAELAARHAGFATSVEVLAGSRKDGLLARLTLEEAAPPTDEDQALYAVLPLRRTNRFAFEARDVAEGLVATLARDAARLGVELRPIDAGLRPAVAELVAEGDRLQWSSSRFRSELAGWSRDDGAAVQDGMPGYAHGLSTGAAAVQRLLLRVRGSSAADERRDKHYALHTRSLVALCTDGDRPADWLAAGRALQRVLLRGTVHGLSSSYFSPAVEVAPVRAKLRRALGARRHPQVLFRLGYGRALRETPRRPVEAVLRRLSAETPPRALVGPLPPYRDRSR